MVCIEIFNGVQIELPVSHIVGENIIFPRTLQK